MKIKDVDKHMDKIIKVIVKDLYKLSCDVFLAIKEKIDKEQNDTDHVATDLIASSLEEQKESIQSKSFEIGKRIVGKYGLFEAMIAFFQIRTYLLKNKSLIKDVPFPIIWQGLDFYFLNFPEYKEMIATEKSFQTAVENEIGMETPDNNE